MWYPYYTYNLYEMQIWWPSLGCHCRCGYISNGWRSMERPLVSIISRTKLIKASVLHKIIKPEMYIVHGNCINIDMPGWCWSSSQLASKGDTSCCYAQIAPWLQHKQTTPHPVLLECTITHIHSLAKWSGKISCKSNPSMKTEPIGTWRLTPCFGCIGHTTRVGNR